MVGAILGGLSALASGISAIQNFQQAKQADRAAQAFANRLQGMTEVNKMAALQAPDIASLSRQQTAQQTAGATQAVQGMGAEGAAQIANIYQAGREAEAQAAQQQAQLNLNVDVAKAQAAQNVEYRNLERQRELEAMRLQGAQTRSAEKRVAGMDAVQGIVGGLGMAAGDIVGLSQFDYPASKQQSAKIGAINQAKAIGLTDEQIKMLSDQNLLNVISTMGS